MSLCCKSSAICTDCRAVYDRFREYLRTMIDAETRDLKWPPMVAMNPMGKEHVPALLDELLAVADDLKGGWTNRYSTEFSLLFGTKAIHKRKWLSAILWSSERPCVNTTRETTLTTIFRAAYISTRP